MPPTSRAGRVETRAPSHRPCDSLRRFSSFERWCSGATLNLPRVRWAMSAPFGAGDLFRHLVANDLRCRAPGP
jgi:hypothetical protein